MTPTTTNNVNMKELFLSLANQQHQIIINCLSIDSLRNAPCQDVYRVNSQEEAVKVIQTWFALALYQDPADFETVTIQDFCQSADQRVCSFSVYAGRKDHSYGRITSVIDVFYPNDQTQTVSSIKPELNTALQEILQDFQ